MYLQRVSSTFVVAVFIFLGPLSGAGTANQFHNPGPQDKPAHTAETHEAEDNAATDDPVPYDCTPAVCDTAPALRQAGDARLVLSQDATDWPFTGTERWRVPLLGGDPPIPRFAS